MREICTSGTVGGEGGNILAYPAQRRRHSSFHTRKTIVRRAHRLAVSVRLVGTVLRHASGEDVRVVRTFAHPTS